MAKLLGVIGALLPKNSLEDFMKTEYTFYFVPTKYNNYELITYGTSSDNCEILSYGENGLINVKLIGVRWIEEYEDENTGEIVDSHSEDSFATFFKDKVSAMKYVVECKKNDVLAIEEEIEILEEEIEKL